jgi:hypothetical protein
LLRASDKRARERYLRAPLKWLSAIKKPTKAIDSSSKASSSNTDYVNPVTDILFGP